MRRRSMPAEERVFAYLRLPERTTKPRKTGLTMVEADVMLAVAGMNWLQDLVEWGGQWIDYFKVGHPMMFQPKDLVLKKLAFLREHQINAYAGGTNSEAATLQGCLEAFFDELQELGINVLEVSSTFTSLTLSQKVESIRKARQRGFTVFAEVGKKLIGAGGPEERMSTADVIAEMKECLSAGAFKVVYEHTEIEELVHKGTGLEPLLEIAGEVGIDNIMFEVPIDQHRVVARYAGFYIRQFGVNVNIGDVTPAQVIHI